MDEILVNCAHIAQRFQDSLPRDFVEDHAPHGYGRLEHLLEVPTDAFALAVLVGGQNQLIGIGELRLEGRHQLLLGGGDHVERLEVILHIHAQARPGRSFGTRRYLGGGGRQVAHVAHAGFNVVARRQKAANGFGLGGGFYNDKFGHS